MLNTLSKNYNINQLFFCNDIYQIEVILNNTNNNNIEEEEHVHFNVTEKEIIDVITLLLFDKYVGLIILKEYKIIKNRFF